MKRLASAGLALLVFTLLLFGQSVFPPAGGSGGVADTAKALAANGANCSAGNYPLGVDASGAVENCTAALTPAGVILAPVAFASIPAAATAGRMQLISDSPYPYAFDTGAAWNYFYPGFGQVTRPVVTGGTWLNQGSTTYDLTNGAGYMASPADAADSVKSYLTAVPGSTFTLTALIVPTKVGASYSNVGICAAESTASNTKFYAFMVFWNQANAGATNFLSVQKATNATTPGSQANTLFEVRPEDPYILKIQVDSTNITFSVVLGNRQAVQVFQEAKTTHMATGTNYIGPCINPRNATYPAGEWILSWVAV